LRPSAAPHHPNALSPGTELPRDQRDVSQSSESACLKASEFDENGVSGKWIVGRVLPRSKYFLRGGMGQKFGFRTSGIFNHFCGHHQLIHLFRFKQLKGV
jgi:hypothetical protein